MERPIAGQGRPMLTAPQTAEQARPFAAELVARVERQTGSRMAAYERVASTVGVSARWLRKLIGRQPIELAAHEYLNIVAAYRSLCERIEAEAELERARAAALRRQADEALRGAMAPLAGVAGPPESGARSCADQRGMKR